MPTVDLRAITIQQPWAWLIVHGYKDIENRDWRSRYRGPLLIHVSAGLSRKAYEERSEWVHERFPRLKIPPFEELTRGAIIGVADMKDCIEESLSRWFVGRYGFVLRNASAFERPINAKGALGLWKPDEEVLRRVARRL